MASLKPTSVPAAGETNNKPLSMRGRKRHKCTVCGNIARSRCPFLSCKGCCVKAGNACPIHVLKPSPNSENVPSAIPTTPSQAPVATTNVKHPYDSLRLRTLRPPPFITKKDAGFINAWRFRKLRAYLDGITAFGDEVFDRYIRNMSFLEEIFSSDCALEGVHPSEEPLGMPAAGRSDMGGVDVDVVLAGLRMRQKCSTKRKEAHRQKLRRAIDRSLQKLHKGEEGDELSENEDFYLNTFAARREFRRMKVQSAEGKERLRKMEVFNALVEKVKVVENQEDFDLCLKTYEENFTLPLVVSEVPKASVGNRILPDLLLSCGSRVDSCGVIKECWKIHDATAIGLGEEVRLESL